jgi:hypothetical protein
MLTWGYLLQGGFRVDGGVNLMAVDGRVNPQSMNEIKTISYVRDFNLDDRENPERIGRNTFRARPRGDGIWVKLTFLDEDVLEGLANLDIGFADSLLEDGGIFVTPPESRGNTQRVFVPRTALRSMEVLGYVTAPSKRNAAKTGEAVMVDAQAKLFSE